MLKQGNEIEEKIDFESDNGENTIKHKHISDHPNRIIDNWS